MHAGAQGTKTRSSDHAHRALQIQPDQHALQSNDARSRILVRTSMFSDRIEKHGHALPLFVIRQGSRDHLRIWRVDPRLTGIVWKWMGYMGHWSTRGERSHVRLWCGCSSGSSSDGVARRGCLRRCRRLCIAFRLCLFGFYSRPPPPASKGQIGKSDGMRMFSDIYVAKQSLRQKR